MKTCSKKWFKSRSRAKRFVKIVNKMRLYDKLLTSVYYCEACQGYHCTSQPKEDRRRKIAA